ncbi:MAG: hypothetical protein ACYYK0_05745 [Candidatus Eutrophobiaceae bacterium]
MNFVACIVDCECDSNKITDSFLPKFENTQDELLIVMVNCSTRKDCRGAIFNNPDRSKKIPVLQTKEDDTHAINSLLSSPKLLDLISSAYSNSNHVKLYRNKECLEDRDIDQDLSKMMRKLKESTTTGRVDNQCHVISKLHSFCEGKNDCITESIQTFKDNYIKINELEKNIFLNGEIGDDEFFDNYPSRGGLSRETEASQTLNEFKKIYERYSSLHQNFESSRPLKNFLELVAIDPYELIKNLDEQKDAKNASDEEKDLSKSIKKVNSFLWRSAFSFIFAEGRLSERRNIMAFLAIHRSYELLLNAIRAAWKKQYTPDEINKRIKEIEISFTDLKHHRNTFFLTHGSRYVNGEIVKKYIDQLNKLVQDLEKQNIFTISSSHKGSFTSKYNKLRDAHFYDLSHLLIAEVLYTHSFHCEFAET